jgi:hypothetical protein
MAEKIYWTRNDVLQHLGLKKSSIAFFESEGGPKFAKLNTGDYMAVVDAVELCKFIISRPKKVKDKTQCRRLAEEFLLSLDKDDDLSASEKEKPKAKRGRPKKSTKAKAVDQPQEEVGMQNALIRAQQAELTAYNLYNESLTKTGVVSVAALESWQKTLDILRKCETDFGRALERRRVLVERVKVQEFLEPMLENTKQKLLNLPSKIAPSLEGLPWHEIQTRIEQEIRDVIEALQNYE